METEEINKILSEKYECYLLLGQEEEFGETDIYLNAYTMGILSLLEGAFEKYPPLKEIVKGMVLDNSEE
jgi:hypothetical protein